MSVTYLRPDFAEGFLCDGRACGSRCCRDWSVWIDPATCGKYHGAEPEEFRREVCRWLEEQEEGRRGLGAPAGGWALPTGPGGDFLFEQGQGSLDRRLLAAQQPLDDERFLLGMDRLTERIDHHRNGMKTVREMAAGMAGGLQFASCLLDAAPDR